MEDHKEEDNKTSDGDTSSENLDADETHDQESLMAFEKQTTSSDSETSDNSEMMMTGSSFWVSDVSMLPSPTFKPQNKSDKDVPNKVGFSNISSEKSIALIDKKGSDKPSKQKVKKKSSFKDKDKIVSEKLDKKIEEQEYNVIVETTESNMSKEVNGGSGHDPSLLVPNKDMPIDSQISLYSQVSNPFNINIIEDNASNEFFKNKSKLSNPKDAEKDENAVEVSQKQPDSVIGHVAEQSTVKLAEKINEKASENKHSSSQDKTLDTLNEGALEGAVEDGLAKPVKKKKKKKKAKKVEEVKVDTTSDVPALEDDVKPKTKADIDLPEKQLPPTIAKTSDPPLEPTVVPKPKSEVIVEAPKAEPKEDIKLHGFNPVPKPVDLDKLLLSNQTNSILKKIKRKKKKVKKVKEEDIEVQPNGDIIIAPNRSSVENHRSGEVKIEDSKAGSEKGNTSELKSSVNSTKKSILSISVKKIKKLPLKDMKTIEQMSGKRELSQVRTARQSNGTPKKFHNSSAVITGGDTDVKTYIKNMKQLEQEKNKFKRELLTGSVSSKGSKKPSKSAQNRYS